MSRTSTVPVGATRERPPLRILIVTPYRPYPPDSGAPLRVFHLIRELARRHRVTVLTTVESRSEAMERALGALGVRVHAIETTLRYSVRSMHLRSAFSRLSRQRLEVAALRMERAFLELTAAEAFDIVQLEESKTCALLDTKPANVVLDLHNVEYDARSRRARTETSALRRVYGYLEARKLKREEFRCWRSVDAVVAPSEREVQIVRAMAPLVVTAVVPNGVDLEYYAPQRRQPEGAELLFVGLLGYRPNAAAVTYFARRVLPSIRHARPDATLTVVGALDTRSPPEVGDQPVNFVGRVPDVRPFLARAAVVVVPLRSGGGTRLKVLEALAAGKAVVATSVGVEGLAVSHGQEALIADAPEAFAESVLRLLREPEFAHRLGQQGRRLVERHYGWHAAAARLEAVYDALCRRTPGRHSAPRPA